MAIALFAGGGVWLLSGPADDEPTAAATPTPSAPATEAAPATPSAVAATSDAPVPARCWDASTAPRVEDCSLPDGAAGLAWVFPQLAGQQCRPPRAGGGPGVVVRVLCSAKLQDGTKVQLGFYQWESVAAGDAYYDAQRLGRADTAGFHGWTTKIGKRTKSAVLYADAPYSRTLVFRTGSEFSPELQHLEPRPPDQLRGEPAA